MQNARKLSLVIEYTTDTERCVERHICGSKEEAEYLVGLTRQLAPLDYRWKASWINA
jgi:hypothetical protein